MREEETASDEPSEMPPSRPLAPSERCAHDLAEQTPEAVRATLDDLGYERLFEDACAAQRAEESGDPDVCSELSVATLRDRCVARVAVAHERASDCPQARTIDGRDPLCVALAARDRRLCVAAGLVDGAACEAALGRERACARLPEEARGQCVSRAADLSSRVHGDVRTRPELRTSLSITTGTGSPRTLGSAGRGARVVYRGCTHWLLLGDPARLTVPFGAAALAFEMVLRDEAPLEVTLSSLASPTASTLTISLDGSRTLHASGGTITLDTIDPALGGVIAGTFHAAFASPTSAIDGTFATFVRDADPRPAGCTAEPSEL